MPFANGLRADCWSSSSQWNIREVGWGPQGKDFFFFFFLLCIINHIREKKVTFLPVDIMESSYDAIKYSKLLANIMGWMPRTDLTGWRWQRENMESGKAASSQDPLLFEQTHSARCFSQLTWNVTFSEKHFHWYQVCCLLLISVLQGEHQCVSWRQDELYQSLSMLKGY